MQGLVQAMQTQAHTQAALQAQLEAQKRPEATFQRKDKKKTVYQTPQRTVAVGSSQVPSVRSPGVKKECPHCGKTHGGSECWLVAGRCLKCGSNDHKIKDCPRLQQGVQRGAPAAPAIGRPGRPRAPARVFALAREDAEQAEHVTEGTVLLLGVHARVLFDTGATHSFIFEQFARQLALESGIESEELEVPLSVHTPAGTVSTRKCIPSLPVCIENRVLDGCFFLLKMKDYDAILGLDWLEEHYALLSLRSSVLDEVIERQGADPRLLELVGKAGIARDEDGPGHVSTDTHSQPKTELSFCISECTCRQMQITCRQIHTDNPRQTSGFVSLSAPVDRCKSPVERYTQKFRFLKPSSQPECICRQMQVHLSTDDGNMRFRVSNSGPIWVFPSSTTPTFT
ncbi:hypothetical protein Taro_048667 [Colocasia esculenta]|uniref:CCHC-type domain-containing protein n=1 Tax=Colocasia esculenta TaxID=4460 RepID=A0A843X8Q5_COLES|nr:hypothetical protein [Colocasia esculenta]